MSEIIKAYKGMSKDMTAYGGFAYEPGGSYSVEGPIRCCNNGLHACEAPLNVLRFYPNRDGNRYFEVEQSGVIDRNPDKTASSEIKIGAEIGLPGLIKAHFEYTRAKAETGQKAGDEGCLAGGADSNLAGGADSNLAGGARSNLAGGADSNLAGGDWSNLAGGARSNLAGGADSNLAGGARSNLAGGASSLLIGRNGCQMKAGLHSILVLTEWAWNAGDEYVPVAVKSVIVDGETIKPDTWYTLKNGEIVEVTDDSDS